MATAFERVRAAWQSVDRRTDLNRVVETMAAEGVLRETLDDALGELLLEIRAAGADDDTEEIINCVGDRLHGWCHVSRHIATRTADSSKQADVAIRQPRSSVDPVPTSTPIS